jgi:isopentenyl diphosphate isomerase/L-lactate dehydrogenase-like FMN-dependent dehydrogenase
VSATPPGAAPYSAALAPWIGPDELRAMAREILPLPIFDYIDSGAESERTVAANRAAFESVQLRPRVLVDVSTREQSTTVLGVPVTSPVLLAPTGQHRIYHPDGEIGTARAAARFGTIAAMSTAASTGIGDTAAAVPDADLWFQFYMPADRAGAEVMLDAAAAAGVGAVCLTVDTPVPGFRERDVRNRMSFPPNVVADDAVWADRPTWTAAYLAGPPSVQPNTAHLESVTSVMNPALAWRDLEWLRGRWPGSLVVKAVTRGDDAARAAECGVDGIVVSNHGGRQLDTMPGTLECLPEVVAAVPPEVEVYLDGGVRRAVDVVKALALGARAVLIGRPYCFALAVGGSDAVLALLEQFRADIDRTLAILGCPRASDLDESFLRLPPTWG